MGGWGWVGCLCGGGVVAVSVCDCGVGGVCWWVGGGGGVCVCVCDRLVVCACVIDSISYSGAILSFKGTPKYKKRAPAPTLFFHGTDDKLVPYNKVQLICGGFYGTNIFVKLYEEKKYITFVILYECLGHSVEKQ